MNKISITLLLIILFVPTYISAQTDEYNQINDNGDITRRRTNSTDSLGSDKEIPKGIKVWTVDSKFGDRKPAAVDTLSHMFMNTIFTTGLRGEYNTTGNLGAPRINRIVTDRPETEQFLFTQPYDFLITPVDKFHFTNTLSPFTNISYNTAGNRTNGEDHFTAKFGVNAGKRIGVGFKFDYIYGRGYYQDQSTSHFNYSMYGSYLGDHYQAHLLFSTNHQKVAENGGITNDKYITHPESFDDNYATNEIPTVLTKNWNRNDNQHIFFSQRYNIGFNRKVKMSEEEIKARKFAIESQKENDAIKAKEEERKNAKREGREFDEDKYNKQETYSGRPDNAKIAGDEPTDNNERNSNRVTVNEHNADSIIKAENKQMTDTAWMKNEYVPVTSFIHTLKFDNFRRIYQAYKTPENFYANDFLPITGDSIYDKTNHYSLQNTFAISLLEGFNKWAKAGLKAFATSELRHFTLPDKQNGTISYNEHNISIGGQLLKTQGHTLHYDIMAETWLTGKDAGQLKVDASADLNIPIWGHTLTFKAKGYFHHLKPTFYYRHYHSRHFWWDNDDMNKIIHSHIEGNLRYNKTHTSIRLAIDQIKNHTYMAMSYNIGEDFARTGNTIDILQHKGNISLLTLSVAQNFKIGPILWENVVTFQKSSNNDVLPVPDLNIYSNLYLRFRIARVLKCDFGADVRYFTKYLAPDYSPALGQYAIQAGESRTETGNYPIANIYANFHLQRTRFFVMMSHINSGKGNKNYFLTPHYPLNGSIFRFGLSWNFFN